MGKDKLIRFEAMKDFENVFQPNMDEIINGYRLKSKWHEVFGNNHPIVLELGCGKGEYTVGMAKMFPEKNFIGIDIKGSRIWRGAKTCLQEEISNVRFLRSKVDFIEKLFGNNEVSEIWLTFSDPQPRKPRKRLTSPLFIERYRQILQPEGTINIKTDSDLLFEYTEEEIKLNKYNCLVLNWDVYGDFIHKTTPENASLMQIKTFYEKRWLQEGKKIKYAKFQV